MGDKMKSWLIKEKKSESELNDFVFKIVVEAHSASYAFRKLAVKLLRNEKLERNNFTITEITP